MIYIVKYSGPFGFIKPWTSVRDKETLSQQFLTPSIVEGIEKKLFPELMSLPGGKIQKILRHRLNYAGISYQQEQTWSKDFLTKNKEKNKYRIKNKGILTRGILLEPNLFLAFGNKKDAEIAGCQTICLCRNEDIVFPDPEILELEEAAFDSDLFPGIELLFNSTESGFKVGQNRFANGESMYGTLKIFGNPIRENLIN